MTANSHYYLVELISQLIAVLAVLALTLAAAWAFRNKGMVTLNRHRSGRLIEVVDQLTLNPHVSVQVVRVRQREFVLVVAATGATVLGESPGERECL